MMNGTGTESMTGTDLLLVCPECGEQVQYHPQHDHYFCLFCREYVKPTSKAAFENKKRAGVACPSCNEPTIRHPEHDHYFCLSCAKYVESPLPSDGSSGQMKQKGGLTFRRWVKKNALVIILAIVIAAAAVSAILLWPGLLSGMSNYSTTALAGANVT